MKRRFVELMVVVGLVAVFMAVHAHHGTVRRVKPEQGEPARMAAAKTSKQEDEYPSFTFRFSSVGGCYADSDYYFEAQSGPGGAKWKARLVAYLDWHELIDRGDDGTRKLVGNFESEGTFSTDSAAEFLEGLIRNGALKVKDGERYPGPPQRVLFLRCDSGAHEATSIQGIDPKPGPPSDPNLSFLNYCEGSLVMQAHEGVKKRFDQGQTPDSQPPQPPGPDWPLDSASLFGPR